MTNALIEDDEKFSPRGVPCCAGFLLTGAMREQKKKTEHGNCLDLADLGRSVLRPYTSSVMLQRGFGWAAKASLKA